MFGIAAFGLVISAPGDLYTHAKFELSSFNRFRDMEGVPKIKKSRSFDPFTTPVDLILLQVVIVKTIHY